MKKQSFLSDFKSVMSSRLIIVILGMVTNVITARYLGPEKSGMIAALMVYPLLFMTIGSLGIRQSTTLFTGQKKHDLQQIYGAVLSICIFTSVFCVLSCYILIRFFTKTEFSTSLIILAVASIPFSLFTTYTSGIFLGNQNIKEFNQINWVPIFITTIFTIILVIIFDFGIEGTMTASFLGSFIMACVVFFKIKTKLPVKPIFDFNIIKGMLSLGIIFALTLLVVNLNYKADIVLLEKFSTSRELGIYTKGATFVEYLWQIPTLLGTLIFSRSSAATDPREFSIKVCRLLRAAIVVSLFASIVLYFCAGLIIEILYGAAFADSVPVLRILIPGVILITAYKILYMDAAGRGKPWLSMAAMLPAVLINVVLNYVWIPKYGAMGSSLASTISYSIAAVTFIVLYSKLTKLTYKEMFLPNEEDKRLIRSIQSKFLK